MSIKHFLALEWKHYFRSSYWQKNMALNILMVFVALYFAVIFLALGVALYPILKEQFPNQDPLQIVNNYWFYWILAELLMRFFFQKMPAVSAKPLLVLPIKRHNIVHYVLGKTTVSFFNFLTLFVVVPFGVMLIINNYPVANVIVWIITLWVLSLFINFLNFVIESVTAETEWSFLVIMALIGGLFAINYFDFFSISALLSNAIFAIYSNPFWGIIPILLLAVIYAVNFRLLKSKLYLDRSLKQEIQEVATANMAWTRRFGEAAPFMQLDLKLIWRNKRPKSSVWILLIGLLYGLFFYPNPTYHNWPWIYAFVGIFVTGIFLINFGQFIPAWDGGYYKMLMSQNIRYKQYLKSKHTLMVLSVIILFILSIPYVYFGWEILLAHFAAAVYNIGVNTHVILFGGVFNRKKIDLNQRAAFNYQGTGAVQWLISIPLMLLPLGIFAAVYSIFNFEIGCLVLTVLGVIGIIFHEKIMAFIVQKYNNSKYKMISAFSQDN